MMGDRTSLLEMTWIRNTSEIDRLEGFRQTLHTVPASDAPDVRTVEPGDENLLTSGLYRTERIETYFTLLVKYEECLMTCQPFSLFSNMAPAHRDHSRMGVRRLLLVAVARRHHGSGMLIG